jgi:hypothetical protein
MRRIRLAFDSGSIDPTKEEFVLVNSNLACALALSAFMMAPGYSFGAVAASSQHTTISYSMGSAAGSPSLTVRVSERALRVSSEAGDALIHAEGDKLVSLDTKSREYRDVSVAELRRSARAQRAGMSSKAGSESSDRAVLTKGEADREVLGRACKHYVVTLGTSSLEAWLAPGLPRPGHFLDSWFVAELASTPFAAFAEKALAALKPTEGMPLALRWKMTIEGRSAMLDVTATEVRQETLSPSAFDVPAGYRKASGGQSGTPR